MAENTNIPESRGLFGGLKNLLRRSSVRPVSTQEPIRTSEITSSDGFGVVGDSMRKMEIMEEAREEGRLINDGDAPQLKGIVRKRENGVK